MSGPTPYDHYVDVNARWLTRVPSDWRVSRVRFLCDVTTGSGDTVDADPGGEYPFYVRSPEALASPHYTFDDEAVLTAGDGAVGEVFHHVRGKFHAHQRVYVLRNFRDVEPRFFFYYFSSLFRLMCTDGSARTTVDSVRRWMITDMPVAIPPAGEQRAITDFLDEQTSRIDTLIDRQAQLITTLRERRYSVTADVLTQGAPGRHELMPTRHAWLGPLPQNWRLAPLWSMYERIKDTGHPDEPMVSVFRDHGVVLKESLDNFNKTAENRDIYQLVRPGWLLTNRMKAWQGSVGISGVRGITSGHYLCFAPRHDQDHEYLNLLFRSPRYTAAYRLLSRGVRPGQIEIDNDQYRLLPVVVPPRQEQRELVQHILEQTSQIDLLIGKTEQHIALAKERRAALITAAVTGQIDVRAAGRAAQGVA